MVKREMKSKIELLNESKKTVVVQPVAKPVKPPKKKAAKRESKPPIISSSKPAELFAQPAQEKLDLLFGVDCGVHTGIAIYDKRKRALIFIKTMMIHRAWELILEYKNHGHNIFVRVEDARKRKWFGKGGGRDKMQGAGSIKRDAKAHEDFLEDHKIKYEMIHPIKGSTKWTKEKFEQRTGWKGQTSNHGRDAALICLYEKKK